MKQFLSIREAAEELDVSTAYIRQLIKGIQANTPYRYTVSDVFNDGKLAVRFVALQDYARYQGKLETAPKYNPIARENELGIGSVTPLSAQEIAKEVIKQIARAAV